MSDNRTLAKGAMIGGVPVYNNVESVEETTMPSTSFFKTEDVDGKPVIISRDNIMGIVKDCLGTILNGLTNQETVTKIPTLNGNTLGASTAATLASVLGAGTIPRISSSFLDYYNSLPESSAGFVTSTSSAVEFLYCKRDAKYGFYIVFAQAGTQTAKLYSCINGTWTSETSII